MYHYWQSVLITLCTPLLCLSTTPSIMVVTRNEPVNTVIVTNRTKTPKYLKRLTLRYTGNTAAQTSIPVLYAQYPHKKYLTPSTAHLAYGRWSHDGTRVIFDFYPEPHKIIASEEWFIREHRAPEPSTGPALFVYEDADPLIFQEGIPCRKN